MSEVDKNIRLQNEKCNDKIQNKCNNGHSKSMNVNVDTKTANNGSDKSEGKIEIISQNDSPTESEKKSQKSGKSKCFRKSWCFIGWGVSGVFTAGILLAMWPIILWEIVKALMIVTPTSLAYRVWQENPAEVYLELFIYNITNTEDILSNQNVKLRVDQLGPYVYKETQTKENITWNDNNTVTFYNKRTWYFQPEMSNGSLTDMVTSVNPVVATVAYLLRNQPAILNLPVDRFLRIFHDNMFLTANASDWFFDGISDPVLDIPQQFPMLPLDIPLDKFAWFYKRNASKDYEGVYVMNTGAEQFEQLGNLEKWRYSDRTHFRDHCGQVKGSMGELWRPVDDQQELRLFLSDACTYLTLTRNRTVSVHNVEGLEFVANYSFFDNGYRYPRMECYCDEERGSNCLPPGTLNASVCWWGSPAFLSLPHFLHTDPYYPSKIDGLAPNDDYNFRLALEMFTGIPLSATAQLQINFLIRHVPGISINNVLPDPDMLIPMFWFRQIITVTPNYANLAGLAVSARTGVVYGLIVAIVIAVGLLAVGVTLRVRKSKKRRQTSLVNNEETRDK